MKFKWSVKHCMSADNNAVTACSVFVRGVYARLGAPSEALLPLQHPI